MRRSTITIAALACSLAVGCGSNKTTNDVVPAAKADSAPLTPQAKAAADVVAVVQLVHGSDSKDALGRAIVAKLNASDAEGMLEVTVTGKEFLGINRALRGDPREKRKALQLAWVEISAVSRSAAAAMVAAHGGKSLTFVGLETTGETRRAGVVEHDGTTLRVKTADGVEQSLGPLGPVIEHQGSGKFKLLSFGAVR